VINPVGAGIPFEVILHIVRDPQGFVNPTSVETFPTVVQELEVAKPF